MSPRYALILDGRQSYNLMIGVVLSQPALHFLSPKLAPTQTAAVVQNLLDESSGFSNLELQIDSIEYARHQALQRINVDVTQGNGK